jgi:hypothetical protein
MAAKAVDVLLADGGRLVGDLGGKVAESPQRRLEVGLPVVVGRVLCEFFRGALGTEVVCVRTNSVMAVVRA